MSAELNRPPSRRAKKLTRAQLVAELGKASRIVPVSEGAVPLPLAQRASELRASLMRREISAQEVANLWTEENHKWPVRDVWFFGVRLLRVNRRTRPIVVSEHT